MTSLVTHVRTRLRWVMSYVLCHFVFIWWHDICRHFSAIHRLNTSNVFPLLSLLLFVSLLLLLLLSLISLLLSLLLSLLWSSSLLYTKFLFAIKHFKYVFVDRTFLEMVDEILLNLARTLVFINSSPPGQNGRHFADDVFRCIFINEKFCILIKISPNFVPEHPIDNNPALV